LGSAALKDALSCANSEFKDLPVRCLAEADIVEKQKFIKLHENFSNHETNSFNIPAFAEAKRA